MTKPDPEPTPPATDPVDDPQARRLACGQAVDAVLKKHRCRMVPYLEEPMPVGTNGAVVQISAAFGIVADPLE